MDYKQIANDVLKAVGGKDNVAAAAHCATRLRLVLRDESLVDEKKLEEIDAVKGTFATEGQYQIIIGTGTVNEVHKEFAAMTGISDMTKEDVKKAGTKKLNPVQQFVKMLSDIFIPILPAIVAGGLLMGIYNIFSSPDLFFEKKSLIQVYPNLADLASMINTFANAAFVFLPILIGFSAVKRFGGNPYLGAVMGMIMVHPDLLNGWGYGGAVTEGDIPVWNILGLEIAKVGYQGTVLPVLAASYVLAKLENFFRKWIPAALDNLLTPLLTVLVTGALTFTIIGPVMRTGGMLLTDSLVWLYSTLGPIGAGLFGLVYAPIVITGMHHSFIAVETQLLADIAKTGGSFLFPIVSMSNVAQGAAALAVLFITKNAKMKSLASASGLSALLGITEPAMFGVNLKLRYPFYAALIGSAVSSAYITIYLVKSVSLGPAGIPGIIAISSGGILHFIIGLMISMAVTFIATILLSKRFGDK
ncbi:sucrose-specific PTS transporter subunit IIBC [Peribacillus frigoritolerans]|uniref:sucrose-specific PTS transporter subunit IIBC n=1 Tax=Peribacillus frigoritolerans TaxID=450367 RepID=UPI00105974FD|nr:sucrose-specific PTS transporter subunit IIBC [Peribacillus frigoritolerans]TDL77956.1 PTS maltose transporter subunit IIBC [Peribacillus frigoritolerans]